MAFERIVYNQNSKTAFSKFEQKRKGREIMKKGHSQLIQYMIQHKNPITSRKLSEELGISIRSVKTYASELNLISDKKLIFSSKDGYSIDVDQARILQNRTEEIPQTSDERINYIVKKLCIEHTTQLDIFELCGTLYVSYSTLKADISKMNRTLSDFNVQFIIKNDFLILASDERSKRKLASHVIYVETDNQFTDASIIKATFKNLNVDLIEAIVRTAFKKYEYYLNDFAAINLLLHFSIIIDRIQTGNYMMESSVSFEWDDGSCLPLVEDICNSFEQNFHIHLNGAEKNEIRLMIQVNVNYTLTNQEALVSVIGSSIFRLTETLIQKIMDAYYIDLYSESFFTPFAMHIKNLLLRVKSNHQNHNPMVPAIRSSYPTIYDIAVFISIQLMQRYNIQIIEDEVAFIALHIGAEIERRNINNSKIKCVLYCPDYANIGKQLYNQLLLEFSTDINIVKTISSLEELPDCYFDLLITTVKIRETSGNYQVMVIPPFLQQANKMEFYKVFSKLHQNNKHYILKKHFDNFFSPELFLAAAPEQTRDDMIHQLCLMLEKQDIVDGGFEANVMKRELAASTAFGSIAIPHSMEMEAVKTSIAVAICRNGLLWDSRKVNLVLMIAINPGTKNLFYELYESLVELFDEEDIISRLKNCRCFEDFKALICQSIFKAPEE